MKIGFSLSPGGLLLPYHVGILSSLSEKEYVTQSTPLAGSSAGAIAVAAHAVGVSPDKVIEGTIRINNKCREMGGARGKLLPLLYEELENLLPQDAHHIANQREGTVGLAYKEIFPKDKNILRTKFNSREDFMESICNSSMFPFFSTNWPCLIRTKNNSDDNQDQTSNANGSSPPSTSKTSSTMVSLPRLIVDGYFTVPRDRFGCPIFPPESQVDRIVTVSVFPHEMIGLTASEKRDKISPQVCKMDPSAQLSRLFTRATKVSSEKICWEMYEEGFRDAEQWIVSEENFLKMERN